MSTERLLLLLCVCSVLVFLLLVVSRVYCMQKREGRRGVVPAALAEVSAAPAPREAADGSEDRAQQGEKVLRVQPSPRCVCDESCPPINGKNARVCSILDPHTVPARQSLMSKIRDRLVLRHQSCAREFLVRRNSCNLRLTAIIAVTNQSRTSQRAPCKRGFCRACT